MDEVKEFFIDTHVHALPEYRLNPLIKWMKNAFPEHGVPDDCKPFDIVRDLYEGGITHFFNLVYPLKKYEVERLNDYNLEFCRNIPGAIPFASVHIETEDKADVAEKALRTGECAGFKLHPFVQKFDPWDTKMEPFYAFLQEVGKPVIFHTGFEDFYGRKMPLSRLRRLMRTFPDLTVVFVHMAFPDIEELFEMMADFPDLYLDATGVLAFFRKGLSGYLPPALSGGKFAEIIFSGVSKFHDRIFFGSDHPVGWGPIDTIFKDLSFLPDDNDILKNIKYNSAVSFIDRFLPGFDWNRNLQNEKLNLNL